jgi:hypothetical protein
MASEKFEHARKVMVDESGSGGSVFDRKAMRCAAF